MEMGRLSIPIEYYYLTHCIITALQEKPKLLVPSASLEVQLLQVLSDMQLQLPATASALLPGLGDVDAGIVASLLQKFATQKLIT